MALVGTYIHKEIKASETETVEYEMTHPDYPSDHPLFEKSGTTETISDAKMEEITQVYDDIYLIVRAASAHQKVGVDGLKSLYVSAMISIYQDKQHKDEDFFNELFQNIIDIRIESLDELKSYNNPFDFAYDKLKEMDDFKQLIND
jgi:hypothetical protein